MMPIARYFTATERRQRNKAMCAHILAADNSALKR
jgi:hypothetical protein